MKLIWSPLAELRALEAVDYIAHDRPQAAAAWHGRRAWDSDEVASGA